LSSKLVVWVNQYIIFWTWVGPLEWLYKFKETGCWRFCTRHWYITSLVFLFKQNHFFETGKCFQSWNIILRSHIILKVLILKFNLSSRFFLYQKCIRVFCNSPQCYEAFRLCDDFHPSCRFKGHTCALQQWKAQLLSSITDWGSTPFN
jgi:hypothetical protein